jgi:hypothetical protein
MSRFNLRCVKITYGNSKFSCCLTGKKYYVSITKKNLLLLLSEIEDIYSDNHTETLQHCVR